MFLTQTFLAFICCVDPHECLENEFSCDENKCLPSRFKCDGIPDCDDATDEENCPEGSTLGMEFPLIHFMFYVVFFITGEMFYVEWWFVKFWKQKIENSDEPPLPKHFLIFPFLI